MWKFSYIKKTQNKPTKNHYILPFEEAQGCHTSGYLLNQPKYVAASKHCVFFLWGISSSVHSHHPEYPLGLLKSIFVPQGNKKWEQMLTDILYWYVFWVNTTKSKEQQSNIWPWPIPDYTFHWYELLRKFISINRIFLWILKYKF